MSQLALLIPMMALAIPITAIVAKHRRHIAEMQFRSGSSVSSDTTAQLLRQTAELEERVRVLERIVTDGGYNLASQIEALRDTGRDTDRTLPPAQH